MVVAENVPVERCDNPKCGEELSGPEAARIRHEAICRALGLLTPDEIRAIREGLSLTQAEFARLTRLGEATICRWERGRLLQNPAMDRYLRLIASSEDNIRFLQRLQDPEPNQNEAPGTPTVPHPETERSKPAATRMADRFEQVRQRHRWEERSWEYLAGRLPSLKQKGIPPRHGVYLIRAPVPLPRVRGSSNVIYIGQSGGGARRGRQGIGSGNGGPGRLFNTRGPDKVVRELIEALFPNQNFRVECAFLDPPEDAELVEAELLRAYLEDHCELPPANHCGRVIPVAGGGEATAIARSGRVEAG